MNKMTREEELEMWLQDAQTVISALVGKINWENISGTWSRDLARHRTDIEKILEKNPSYLQGKLDRIAGQVCVSKDAAYRRGYWCGVSGKDLPPAVDGCDWTVERAAHQERMTQRFHEQRDKRLAAEQAAQSKEECTCGGGGEPLGWCKLHDDE